jgi:hypothetical protein
MLWNFFATCHGKGEVDGARALFKREAKKEQLKSKGQKIQNVIKVVAFWKLNQTNTMLHTLRPSII